MPNVPAPDFKTLREKAGLDLHEAADLIEVSLRTAYRYESGKPLRKLEAKTLEAAGHTKSVHALKPHDFTFVDLFAGIGGLRGPFEKIGGQCVFTCEWDDHSRISYSKNFAVTHEYGRDIRDYSKAPTSVPDHDVLLAGFPCQPFSIAGVSKKNALGRPHGFLCDTQGTLFFDLAQIIQAKRPAAFVLENVKNLENHNQGDTFRTIMNVLQKELKYNVQKRVISSDPWVPQKRERIIIVGFREETSFDFEKLTVPKKRPTLGDILEPHDEVDPKYTLTPKLWEYLQAYKKKHTAKGNGFGFSLFGPNDVARTLSARYYKDGSEILIAQPGKRPRRLTPRECARLMGFDSPRGRSWKIEVSDTQAYRQFGNAVVVPVIHAVAKLMKPHIVSAVKEEEPQQQIRAHG